MTVNISKPALNLREELASLRNQGASREDKLYLDGIITNGQFAYDGDWELTEFTISGGKATHTQSGTGTLMQSDLGLIQNNIYVLKFDVANRTQGNLYPRLGSYSNLETLSSNANGSHTYIVKAQNVDRIEFVANSGFDGEIDNVSVQEVGRNLVSNGEFDRDLLWSKGTDWSITGGVALHSSTNASYLQQDHDVVETGKTYFLSYDIVTIGSGQVMAYGVNSYGIGGTTAGTYSGTFVATNNIIRFRATGNAQIDNVRLYEGNHPVIQRVSSAYDVKDVYIDGELAREGEGYDYQVKTDGIDQWIKLEVEPTSTTETVVIGVRK